MVEKMVKNLRTNPQSPGRNPPITRSTSWTWKTFSNTGPKDKRVWFNSCSCLCTKNIHFKSPLSPPWNTKIAITLISGVLLSPSEVLTVTSFLWRSTVKKTVFVFRNNRTLISEAFYGYYMGGGCRVPPVSLQKFWLQEAFYMIRYLPYVCGS